MSLSPAPPAGGTAAASSLSLRVRVWRRLCFARRGAAQALRVSAARHAGALRGLPVALAGDPARGRGEARLVRVQQIENMSAGGGAAALPRAARSRLSAARRALPEAPPEPRQEVWRRRARARRARQAVERPPTNPRNRFFRRPRRRRGRRLEEAITMRTPPPGSPRRGPARPADISTLRGRQWVTRPRPHVDRIASAWLIKRFIDTAATFVFADPAAFPHGCGSVRCARRGASHTTATTARSRRLSSARGFGIAVSRGSPRSCTRRTFATATIPTRRRAGSIW